MAVDCLNYWDVERFSFLCLARFEQTAMQRFLYIHIYCCQSHLNSSLFAQLQEACVDVWCC